MEVFTAMANDVFPSLTFTHDLPEEHLDSRVPMLDFACWGTTTKDCSRTSGTKQVVSHAFYEKKCVSSKVLEYGSALPLKTKIITLTQEILRRMRNTARREPVTSRVDILNTFFMKMTKSGYPIEVKKTVLESGLRGYYRMVLGEVEGIRRVNMAA